MSLVMKFVNTLLLAALCAFGLSTAAQAATNEKEVASLMKAIDESMFPSTATASLTLTSYRNGSATKTIAMDMVLKADNGLLAFSAPATDKGKYLLKAGKNLWMYFSDVKRSIRLASRDSFMGTDATNYDMLQLNLVSDYEVTAFADATLDGQPVLKVELAAKKDTEGYARITSWVDPRQQRLLKNDCYALSGALLKTIHYADPVAVGRFRIPSTVRIVNHLDTARTTTMKLANVQPRDDVPAATFTLGYLESLN